LKKGKVRSETIENVNIYMKARALDVLKKRKKGSPREKRESSQTMETYCHTQGEERLSEGGRGMLSQAEKVYN